MLLMLSYKLAGKGIWKKLVLTDINVESSSSELRYSNNSKFSRPHLSITPKPLDAALKLCLVSAQTSAGHGKGQKYEDIWMSSFGRHLVSHSPFNPKTLGLNFTEKKKKKISEQ